MEKNLKFADASVDRPLPQEQNLAYELRERELQILT
jgi:hypothetical protein